MRSLPAKIWLILFLFWSLFFFPLLGGRIYRGDGRRSKGQIVSCAHCLRKKLYLTLFLFCFLFFFTLVGGGYTGEMKDEVKVNAYLTPIACERNFISHCFFSVLLSPPPPFGGGMHRGGRRRSKGDFVSCACCLRKSDSRYFFFVLPFLVSPFGGVDIQGRWKTK